MYWRFTALVGGMKIGKQRSGGMVADVQVGRTSSSIRLHGFGRDLVSGLTLVKFSS